MNNKLKVSTCTGGIFPKHEKILRCLGAYPEGTTPKTIALRTSINVNTVKSILPRLQGVKKIMRGFYKVVVGGDGGCVAHGDLLSWNFHNLVMSTDLGNSHNNFKTISATYNFGLINCEFTISIKGQATLRVSCDTPLNVASINMVYGFFSKLVSDYSDAVIYESEVFIKTVEFNKDYANLRLDGLRCVTVESLCAQFKVYQKRLALRVEHKIKVPLSVENLVDMLQGSPVSLDLDVKLAALKAQLDRQVVATERLTKGLLALIDRLIEKETED